MDHQMGKASSEAWEPGDPVQFPADPTALLGALGHAVIATDLPGTVQFWNPEAELLYGWTAAEAIGRNVAELIVPQMTRKLGEQIMAALRAGSRWSGSFTVMHKDGSTFTALVSDTGIYDDTGELIGLVGASSSLDRAVLPALVRTSDAALVLAPDSTISHVTPAAARLFGWADNAALGVSLWDIVHPADREAAMDHHRRVQTTETPLSPLECRLLSVTDWRWAEIVMTDMVGDPAVRGVVCHLQDVTARREDRERLVQRNSQLETALTSRVTIDRAVGMTAGRAGTTLDHAFDALRRYARGHNRRLNEVAGEVVAGHLRIDP